MAAISVQRLLTLAALHFVRPACTVLKQIGTQKSVPALRELMLDPDQSVNSSAAEAVRSITARE